MEKAAILLIVLSAVVLAVNMASLSVPAFEVLLFAANVIIIFAVLMATYLMTKTRHKSILLIIIGIIVVLLGLTVWFYGDFHDIALVEWSGGALVVAGTVVWIFGDDSGGAFDVRIAKYLEEVEESKRERYTQ